MSGNYSSVPPEVQRWTGFQSFQLQSSHRRPEEKTVPGHKQHSASPGQSRVFVWSLAWMLKKRVQILLTRLWNVMWSVGSCPTKGPCSAWFSPRGQAPGPSGHWPEGEVGQGWAVWPGGECHPWDSALRRLQTPWIETDLPLSVPPPLGAKWGGGPGSLLSCMRLAVSSYVVLNLTLNHLPWWKLKGK